MDIALQTIPYKETGFFSPIILDYLSGDPKLQPFYEHPVSIAGIRSAIAQRQQAPSHRNLLADILEAQYAGLELSEQQRSHLAQLRSHNSFTITTAHQPNIFTGYLYFIYKILHAIKLADRLQQELPGYHFIPVFYMGSEDNDLDELGTIHLNGEKLVWDTTQTGAVGRMHTKGLEQMVTRIAGELGVQPYGNALAQLLRDCYDGKKDVQTATLHLVHALFAEYGLLVLLPDNDRLKALMQPVFEDDLLHQTASGIVAQTITALEANYKVQAQPRAINLFYLKDDIRARIEWRNERYQVLHTTISFSRDEMLQELRAHPERFSPNVILRGLFQETILPNIAFIGGGGELAYWLELKALFQHYKVPYPMLVLRNSFAIVPQSLRQQSEALGFSLRDLFEDELTLQNAIVARFSANTIDIAPQRAQMQQLYDALQTLAAQTDITLSDHVINLREKALKKIDALQKKILRKERQKFETENNRLHHLRQQLFPRNSLQERIDNFMPWYAAYGPAFIRALYNASYTLDEGFVIVEPGK
jgi:bacillithiol biosynthesis cysteine-adding enzyme BshC